MSAVPSEEQNSRQNGRRSRRASKLSASDAAAAATEQLSGLTSKQPDMVTSVKPDEDGWRVELEIVEDRRIPSSSDILALYEVELDASGELLSYRRTQRYVRGRAGGEGR